MRDAAAAVARTTGWVLHGVVMGGALALGAAQAGAVPLPLPRPAGLAASGDAPSVAPLPPVPLPPVRPEEDDPSPPPAPRPDGATRVPEAFGPVPPPVPPPPAPPEPDPVCGRLMVEGKVVVRAAPPMAGPPGCGIAAPVTLDAVVLRDGRRVPLVPPALMRCDLADRIADWLRDDVALATAAEGNLLGVTDAAAYACRGRNRLAGARISEHARGNAIDILAFRFARRVIGLKGADARDVLAAIRGSACARFSTVLGPGSDAFHETDLHLDLEHRRNGYRLCQWDVP